ncbi:uncharacterized protein F5891DRAFT_1033282 [Suillus fuscotomentosus]|uniref:Uncharacterized protein n=1 Tax=Suillus fuscotomentosus TaxID=1912939 RepID=A0AAD4E643_9AGAM|nr:uncharacterized protein F5891DRAFT_1033282 [Suillus fuscotomentosus]KAG1900290.1 hypothetical protein F5891DRAFT_1033282 [Suillus fuscotomentosus]
MEHGRRGSQVPRRICETWSDEMDRDMIRTRHVLIRKRSYVLLPCHVTNVWILSFVKVVCYVYLHHYPNARNAGRAHVAHLNISVTCVVSVSRVSKTCLRRHTMLKTPQIQ